MLASIIFSENFDSSTPALGVTTAGQFQTFGGTNVDIVGGALFGSLCAAPESGNCVDMNGTSGNSLGELTTNLSLAAGTYFLSFDLIGSQRGVPTSTTVDFGPYSQTFLLASGDNSSGIIVNEMVTITAGTQLEFVSNAVNGGNVFEGALLDDVVISTSPVVPEPATISLLATGLLGCAGAIRGRFSA
jgi:hypothetical protein